jgi:hypothetical protein
MHAARPIRLVWTKYARTNIGGMGQPSNQGGVSLALAESGLLEIDPTHLNAMLGVRCDQLVCTC